MVSVALCEIVQCLINVFFQGKTAHFSGHFFGTSPGHTCAIIMMFNQHLNAPHLSGGWAGRGELLPDTVFNKFVCGKV